MWSTGLFSCKHLSRLYKVVLTQDTIVKLRCTMAVEGTETDVAVVGGGPGGLATAAALLSSSAGRLRVKVSSL